MPSKINKSLPLVGRECWRHPELIDGVVTKFFELKFQIMAGHNSERLFLFCSKQRRTDTRILNHQICGKLFLSKK